MPLQNLFLSLCALGSLSAKEPQKNQKEVCQDSSAVYFGGFGGAIFSNPVSATQRGTAFFLEAAGGPLDVFAQGHVHGKTAGFGGLHIGYEWMRPVNRNFRLAPAIELEGYYFANTRKGTLDNPTSRLPEHLFDDTFRMRIGTLLVNGILELSNDYISPYFGVGIGAGMVGIHGADSEQVAPVELGVNHFNSGTHSFSPTFAAQAKAGLRYRFLKHYRLFAEYRFLYLTFSDYTFGSTRYPTHPATSTWSVALGGMCYNAVSFGIDFLF